MNSAKFIMDGYPFLEPKKGLSVVAGAIAKSLVELDPKLAIEILTPPGVNLDGSELVNNRILQKTLNFRRSRINYIDRLNWTNRVGKFQRSNGDQCIFFPYANNAGNKSENIIIIPDIMMPSVVMRSWAPHSLKKYVFGKIRLWFIRAEVRRAAQAHDLIVHSEFIKRQVLEKLDVPENKVHVVSIAPQLGIEESDPISARHCLKQAGFEINRRFVFYVGGYAERKNISLLLEACKDVWKKSPDYFCVFAGGAANSEVIAAQNKYPKHILALPALNQKILNAFLNLCEFTLYPSRCEGFGLPIIEAAKCAKLCLCGDNTSQIELQPNPHFRIAADDLPNWIATIHFFWSNPEQAIKAGVECRTNGMRFNWASVAVRIYALYFKIRL